MADAWHVAQQYADYYNQQENIMAKNDSNTIRMKMVKDKETPGTVRFKEQISDDARPHQFYLIKETFEKLGRPSSITLTIETD